MRRASRRSRSEPAASAMTVPGPKISAAPGRAQRRVVVGRDHAADDDEDVRAARAPRARRAAPARASGARRRASSRRRRGRRSRPPPAPSPPASGRAGRCRRRSPRSANAVAMTFCPRSWPSCPIFATRMRGRRPSRSRNAFVRARTVAMRRRLSRPPRQRTRPRWRGSRPGAGPRPSRAPTRSRPPMRARARGVDRELEEVAPSPLGARR